MCSSSVGGSCHPRRRTPTPRNRHRRPEFFAAGRRDLKPSERPSAKAAASLSDPGRGRCVVDGSTRRIGHALARRLRLAAGHRRDRRPGPGCTGRPRRPAASRGRARGDRVAAAPRPAVPSVICRPAWGWAGRCGWTRPSSTSATTSASSRCRPPAMRPSCSPPWSGCAARSWTGPGRCGRYGCCRGCRTGSSACTHGCTTRSRTGVAGVATLAAFLDLVPDAATPQRSAVAARTAAHNPRLVAGHPASARRGRPRCARRAGPAR